jgi:hypothetical protein
MVPDPDHVPLTLPSGLVAEPVPSQLSVAVPSCMVKTQEFPAIDSDADC